MSLQRVSRHSGGPGEKRTFVSQGGTNDGRAEVAPQPPLFRAPTLEAQQNPNDETPKVAHSALPRRSWHVRMEEDTKSRMWNGRPREQPRSDMQPPARTPPHSSDRRVDMWQGSSSYNPYYKRIMVPRGYVSPGSSRATTFVHSEPTLYSSASSWGNPIEVQRQLQQQQQHARSLVYFPQRRDMNPVRFEAKSAPNTHMGMPPPLAMEGMVPMPQISTVNPTPPATPRGRWARTDLLRQPTPAIGGQAPIPAIVIDSGEGYSKTTQPKKPQPNKPFACDVCQKRFGTRSLVKRHKMIHSDSRPHPCPDCPKRFRQREHLIKHQRLHTGERPFKCPHCPMDFVQKSTMTGHIRTRHSCEKAVQCNGCGERFYTRNHLRNHRPKCPALSGVLGFM